MRNTRSRDTRPELALRRELFRRGLRYRVNRRPEPSIRSTADLLFPRARVAVYVDGCFWHSCPDHGNLPRANSEWWRRKLEGTVARDRRNESALADRGWLVIRVWEHERADEAAERIARLVVDRRTAAERPGLVLRV